MNRIEILKEKMKKKIKEILENINKSGRKKLINLFKT